MKALIASSKGGSRTKTPRPQKAGATARSRNSRLKIASILVPIDFSPPSEKALAYALHLAATFNAKVTLLHVLEVRPGPEFAAYQLLANPERSSAIRKKLAELARKNGCAKETLEEVKIRSGIPFREITSVAQSTGIDLIVIATHGYTGLNRVLLGSTAERVVRYAPCPVLVVPAGK